ncbi:galectin-9 isoform X2 [Salmo salar]|uniref:Galectin n=1 Tax=Salmo salar TaxID=8030 RepID=B5XAH5_SALSA|nr:galectin-9 isoform X2 [Salmo salar]ACI67845.1 Galectin-9 [Salmo salar]|eukprot:XP_013992934.1 PREDICTED: galectin-9-like isoform X2 [Salmo salar]
MSFQQPFFNPRVPFTGCIQGALHEGMTITVTGRVLPGAQRFHVNLQCGSRGNPDIALHFNPRYDSFLDVVICNTMQHSKWGSEEREYFATMTRGANFTLMFLVNRDSYSIFVNGVLFMEYLHRLSFSRVDTISVNGGVEVQSIAFSNPAVTSPPPQPGYPGHPHSAFSAAGFLQAPPPYTAQPPYTPKPSFVVPYKNIMAGGLYPGRNITIQGVVNHNADKFCINLRFNSGVAFHFNPRFNENVVVRNSLLKEQWGQEERTGGMPFYRGQPFTVIIMCDTQCYKVMVNGALMFSYNHRHFLFQQIDILEVEGDMSLSAVLV